jgi:hypothetical protein
MSRAPARALPALLLLSLAGTVFAQEEQDLPPAGATPPPPLSSSTDRDGRRLFQRFAEDAAILPGGWTEFQFVYDDFGRGDSHQFLGGLFAFRLGEQVEAGLRLGYARQDADPGPDGSGLSDVEVYGKYRLHGGGGCAIGGLVKAGNADADEGLGTGAMDVEGFVGCRADLAAVSLVGNAGVRYNGNPDPPLPDSAASLLAGGALIMPTGARSTFVIEATYETERLDGAGTDARLTLGYQGVARPPGFGFRGAVAIPLTDAAPDWQALFGLVYMY